MKSEYEKYMKEVWKMKEKSYDDFKKSGCRSYADFIKKDVKGIKIHYRSKKKVAA